MAIIVGGIAASHGPLLCTPPAIWHLRGEADRKSKTHWYRGTVQDYEALLARRAPGFEAQVQPAEQQRQHAACQHSLDDLAVRYRALKADFAIIVGNDQREVFKDDMSPALMVYTGERVENIPLDADRLARLPPGIREAEEGHCPHGGAVYAGMPAEADALVRSLIEQDFDVATSARLPKGADRQEGIPHAYGFIYRRILQDAPPPSIPVFVNVGVPPNQVQAPRALAFGRALAKAVQALPGDARVAIIASGGMSHFVVDEELDARVLKALKPWDEATLAAIPERHLQGNTSELKSWLVVAAAMQQAGLAPTSVEYTACYRTPAGTGSGMGFVAWA
jgi:Catalytic LigB subunit of aromatic ring-opening dioxygenase